MTPARAAWVCLAVLAAGAARAAEPIEFQVGEFTFERPEGWKWVVSNSPMRKAQLAVAAEGGESCDVVFFHFGAGQGGSVAANVERWLGQFQPLASSATREESFAGRTITFVEAEGTFLSGMPGAPATPLDGMALRGAILPSSGGDVYVRLTGPAAAVSAASEAFVAMVRGAASR